jgi:MoaA/NifB/PqqE/SkfB family radical SAM enzyme
MRCLSIHLTDLCNSKCSFWVVGSPLHTKDTIDYDHVVAFLRANACLGYEAVNLHGGEATIHPRFFDTLNLIRSLGYHEIHLPTNGIKLAMWDFARRVVDFGVRLFIVSLHGNVDAIQVEQTGTRGGFQQTTRGIRNVKGLGARVRTNTVITRQNVDRLPAISQLAIQLGVDHLNFSNLHPVGSAIFGIDRMIPNFAAIRQRLYPAIDLAVAAGRNVTLEGFPYCTIREHMDLHLNNEHRDIRMLYRGRIIDDYDAFMNRNAQVWEPCADCELRPMRRRVFSVH